MSFVIPQKDRKIFFWLGCTCGSATPSFWPSEMIGCSCRLTTIVEQPSSQPIVALLTFFLKILKNENIFKTWIDANWNTNNYRQPFTRTKNSTKTLYSKIYFYDICLTNLKSLVCHLNCWTVKEGLLWNPFRVLKQQGEKETRSNWTS